VTATTNASGVATFTNLGITGSGAYTLRFVVAGLVAVTGGTINVSNAVVATRLAITAQPSSAATTGVAFSQQPSVQLLDASNNPVSQSSVVVTAAITSGSGSLGGTLTATTNSSGIATFANLSITGGGAYTVGFSATGLTSATSATVTVGGGGGFVTPNILNNASFETNWEGFTNGAGGTPTTVRDNTLAAPGGGAWSIKEAWTPNPGGDAGTATFYDFLSNPQDHIWVRFYFRVTAPITTIMKFMRFDSAPGRNTHLGGIFMGQGGSIFTFGSDVENGAAQTQLSLSQSQITDGNWHSMEMEYWRNGDPSGFPTAAFWFDGSPVCFPDGTGGVAYPLEMTAHWSACRLNVGARGSSEKLGSIEWLSTLNAGNTTTGQVNIDRISISSLGRIGP
jgi:hypothetical protein